MRNTFTNQFLSLPHAEVPTKAPTYQFCSRNFKMAPLPHRHSKLKRQTIIFFALFMIVVASAMGQSGPMVAGTYTVTSGTAFTWYDPGNSGGTTCPGSGA